MATRTIAGLEELLGRLGLKVPHPHSAGTDVLYNPLDIGRSYLADILSSLVEGDAVTAFSSIQWPNNIESGDLSVVLPRLRPGVKPNVIAFDFSKKVKNSHIIYSKISLILIISSPSQDVHSSPSHSRWASIS